MKINIIIPVFNDWESLNYLLNHISKIINNKNHYIDSIDVTIIDDASTLDHNIQNDLKDIKIKILKLNNNLGSQNAINIGLRYLEENNLAVDYCIVMDSDGEDKAEDIIKLIQKAEQNKNKIIFASRAKREDGVLFFLFYKIYLFSFYLLTGENLNFGNFSCIPKQMISSIIKLDNSKDHYPAAILRSDLAYIKVKCDRGKRYKGKSKMSISKLALHGLNGLSFFVELVLVRFFILSIIGMIFSLLIIISVILLKINNLIGVLNWATNTTIGFAILFVIFLLIGFLSLLNLLNRNISKKEEEENNLNELIKKITTF